MSAPTSECSPFHWRRRLPAFIAFEPQPRMYELLRENIEQNNLQNVSAHQLALGAVFGKAGLPSIDYDRQDNFGGVPLVPGSDIKVATLDSFNLDACNLIKIDVEGMEADVLAGAKETIKRHHPLLYVENDRLDKSVALISLISDLGYEMYWHAPYLYNPDNFNGVTENIFPNTVTVNMLCVPKGIVMRADLGAAPRRLRLRSREWTGASSRTCKAGQRLGWRGTVRRHRRQPYGRLRSAGAQAQGIEGRGDHVAGLRLAGVRAQSKHRQAVDQVKERAPAAWRTGLAEVVQRPRRRVRCVCASLAFLRRARWRSFRP